MTRPNVLLESWLPFDAIGAESMRERGASSALPPLYFLHVWWARRPLTVSRAAVVASLLPSWEQLHRSDDFQSSFHGHFPTAAAYHAWFLRLMGIHGDPVAARKLLEWGRQQGKFIPNPYTHQRAFTVNPTPEDLALLEDLLALAWGEGQPGGLPLRELVVLDPFAGGGSIPFEARRYGLGVVANELNPVAAVILEATLDYPARFGPDLAVDIKKWGQRWYELVRPRLQPFFTPLPDRAEGAAYLWARTVACPVTGKPVPLSPNWWLSKDPPVAVRLLAEPAWDGPRFEIVRNPVSEGFNPDEGTIARGVARSPWTGDAVDGDYIKVEAQAGRMGQMLYVVAVKRRGGFDFRASTAEDLAAARAAEEELARVRARWEAEDIIPTEPIPDGLKTAEPMRYGMIAWAEMFSPRQLLAIGTFVETLRGLRAEMRAAMDEERAKAAETYLALAIDKAISMNSRQCRWDPIRPKITNVFERHDFAMRWAGSEFDASANLLPWCVDQVYNAYKGIAQLVEIPRSTLESHAFERGPLTVLQGNAADLSALPDGSVYAVVTDPPYYDNVMYAELSDFFYVWLKRTVGHLYPGWFAAHLTDKDAEAVANPARFKALTPPPTPSPLPKPGEGRGPGREPPPTLSPLPKPGEGRGPGRGMRALAERDYERKMAAAFREIHRVLRDDGVLTVMFTHKRVEAWDTLATALIGAGFSVEASWPVHTESEYSLHQAHKNAAQSTILLCCRKRGRGDEETRGQGDKETRRQGDEESISLFPLSTVSPSPVWWDDVAPEVRRVAREKAQEFAARGIVGVDLYLSTFGPALSVISRQWPVLTHEVDERTGQPRPLRPEAALDLARQEVIALRKRGLLGGREVQFDPPTDWYLMAWDAFRAAEFPADEARKLAIALGLEVEHDLVARRVISKKGSDVVLLEPKQRRGRGKADPEAQAFDTWLDAVHTALLVYEEDGAQACEEFLKRTGLRNDGTFKACLQAMLNAVPRVRVKGRLVRPEAEVLERVREAFFEELEVPGEEEEEEGAEQLELGLK